MKTTMKLSGIILMVIMLGFMPQACKKDGADYGSMQVLMTDAPANYLSVNVDVTGLEVQNENAGWISLAIAPGVYDLLTLQNNVTVMLANQARIPIGRVNQIRLILGKNNSLVDGSGTHALTIPSGAESGLKINVNTEIKANNTVQIVLDFDANASVITSATGEFQLKPVLRVKSVSQS